MHTATAPASPVSVLEPGDPLPCLSGPPDRLSSCSDRDLPCRVQDPDLWFADEPAVLERAKSLCADCPVRAACLSGALARQEPWGVWGGEIFDHGVVIARKRPRGRPRKVAA